MSLTSSKVFKGLIVRLPVPVFNTPKLRSLKPPSLQERVFCMLYESHIDLPLVTKKAKKLELSISYNMSGNISSLGSRCMDTSDNVDSSLNLGLQKTVSSLALANEAIENAKMGII